MDWLWKLLAQLFGNRGPDLAKLPDDKEIPADQADQIVGNVDDTPPVVLEEGDAAEVPDPETDPEFDAAHPEDDETDSDPAVVITDDPEDGSVYSDGKAS